MEAIFQELARLRDDLVDMRLLVEEGFLQPPEIGKGRIVQAQAPIGADQRHAFMEIVKRFALHAGDLVEGALQLDFIGGVLV